MTNWDKEVKRAAERAMEAATAVIRKDGPKSKPFCVYSEKTGRKFGCYPTRKQAEKRLAQIEMFKHIKGENQCYCDGPINNCQNDWDGDGPSPPCPNAPEFEGRDVDV